ncbi:unnamed protein product [Durusdinium trenchii]|uniref:CSD domain-containing protein n=1 Tax=Durusdinium trenchii TaxID=1381693 RepID=A0ABP0QQH0_9DINO
MLAVNLQQLYTFLCREAVETKVLFDKAAYHGFILCCFIYLIYLQELLTALRCFVRRFLAKIVQEAEGAREKMSALPNGTGTCTSFNRKGFGFIDMNGVTVFVHVRNCEPRGKAPKVGDFLTFQYEPNKKNPEQMEAYNVKGCTGVDEAWSGSFAGAGPVEGTGAYSGTVISFGPKGFGFISMGEGQPELFFNAKDCVGSKPVTGDTVKFDLTPSDAKPGQMQARNVTGGSQPLDSPHPGTTAWGGDWGSMGDVTSAMWEVLAKAMGKGWGDASKGMGMSGKGKGDKGGKSGKGYGPQYSSGGSQLGQSSPYGYKASDGQDWQNEQGWGQHGYW